MAIKSYRDLLVWPAAMSLAAEVYAVPSTFPAHELVGIIGQVRRSAVSIAANITEGHAHSSTKEYLKHLSIARGSLAELETLLAFAERLGYCCSEDANRVLAECGKISRLLSTMQSRLRQRLVRGTAGARHRTETQ